MSNVDGVGAGETRLVRIKPLDEKAGHKTRRFMSRGTRFFEDRGWYEVDSEFATYLSGKHVNGDKRLPKIFDVCTRAEAIEMERAEAAEKERLARASATQPNGPRRAADFTTARGTTLTMDDINPVAKSARPIVADGADTDDEPEDDDTKGLAPNIGKLEVPTDETFPTVAAPRAPAPTPAPASRASKNKPR